MTTLTRSAGTTGAAQWLRELVAARTRCEEEFGWPVTVEVERRRLVVAVGEVLDAVTMPVTLGEKVLAQLRIAMLDGPVIGCVGGDWTFLTTPEAASRLVVSAELAGRGVRFAPRGALVMIPGPGEGEGLPRWVEVPRTRRPLPPWPAVVATTRRVVDQLPGHSLSMLDSRRGMNP